jgi:hypothetical protein
MERRQFLQLTVFGAAATTIFGTVPSLAAVRSQLSLEESMVSQNHPYEPSLLKMQRSSSSIIRLGL